MNAVELVPRTTIDITFSRQFESLLLAYPSAHYSLTTDLEIHLRRGLRLLEELEDVHDLKHLEVIKKLVRAANEHGQIGSDYFTSWKISIANDLLDEVDLLTLTHGEDLLALGLFEITQGAIVVFAVIASFELTQPLVPAEKTVTHFGDTFRTRLASVKKA